MHGGPRSGFIKNGTSITPQHNSKIEYVLCIVHIQMATLCAQCDTIVLNYKPDARASVGMYEYPLITIREYAGLSELDSAALSGCAFCKFIWRLTRVKQGKQREQFSRIECSFDQLECSLRVIFETGTGSQSYEHLQDIYAEPGSLYYYTFYTLHTHITRLQLISHHTQMILLLFG